MKINVRRRPWERTGAKNSFPEPISLETSQKKKTKGSLALPLSLL